MSLKEIVDAVNRLKPEEVRELRARLAVLDNRVDMTTSTEERELFEAIASVLMTRGIPTPPLSVYRRTDKHYARLRRAAPAFSRFIEEKLAPKTKTLRLRALVLVVDALARRLEGNGVPLSVSALVGVVPNAPSEVARMFPGYAQAGLLGKILA